MNVVSPPPLPPATSGNQISNTVIAGISGMGGCMILTAYCIFVSLVRPMAQRKVFTMKYLENEDTKISPEGFEFNTAYIPAMVEGAKFEEDEEGAEGARKLHKDKRRSSIFKTGLLGSKRHAPAGTEEVHGRFHSMSEAASQLG